MIEINMKIESFGFRTLTLKEHCQRFH